MIAILHFLKMPDSVLCEYQLERKPGSQVLELADSSWQRHSQGLFLRSVSPTTLALISSSSSPLSQLLLSLRLANIWRATAWGLGLIQGTSHQCFPLDLAFKGMSTLYVRCILIHHSKTTLNSYLIHRLCCYIFLSEKYKLILLHQSQIFEPRTLRQHR